MSDFGEELASDASEGEAEDDDNCTVCGRPGHLILCENHEECRTQVHCYCVELPLPPLAAVDWYCIECAVVPPEPPDPTEPTFECIICCEERRETHKLAVAGCSHKEFACSRCLWKELYESHRLRCPICRREADAVIQVVTGDIRPVEAMPSSDVEDVPVDPTAAAIQAMRAGATSLDLSGGRCVSSSAIQMVADELKVNRSVTYLNLSQNHLDSEAAKTIAMALCSNTTLQHLDVEGNNFNSNAAKTFASIFDKQVCRTRAQGRCNLTLARLGLDFNSAISRSGWRALRGVRSTLEVGGIDDEEEQEDELAAEQRARRVRQRLIEEESDEDNSDDENEDEDENDSEQIGSESDVVGEDICDDIDEGESEEGEADYCS
jgi:hypothetical protein